MDTDNRTRGELLAEIEELRYRLEEAEETLRAIQSGEVDALVVSRPEGEQIYTLQGAEHSYRVLVETMNEGAATLTDDGTILYCNRSLAAMLRASLENLIGTPLSSYVDPACRPFFAERLHTCAQESRNEEITLITGAGSTLPALISVRAVELPGGNVVSAVLTDITAIKEAETQIQIAAERERFAEELRASNEELTRMNRLMVGRELRMVELKNEVNALCAQAGQPPRYTPDSDMEQP